MRPFIAGLLLFAIMLPTLTPWGTVAYFRCNRSYIAKVLCENRDRPKLNCNGKCYLAKKLKQQQDKKDKETTERVENAPFLLLYFATSSELTLVTQDFTEKQETVFRYDLPDYSAHKSGLLRPPQII